MARLLQWDAAGERLFETGLDRGVLYPMDEGKYGDGVAWNGLTSVSESPTGAEPNPLYADNIKYLNLMSTEEFEATIEAYTYPEEFEACDGSAELKPGISIGQQRRNSFGLAYRTKIGNDEDGVGHGYKLHLVYGALASPSEKSYETINDTPDAITFSWSITTTPVEITNYEPSAKVTIDSTKVSSTAMAEIEELLYGSKTGEEEGTPAKLPLPSELISIIEEEED